MKRHALRLATLFLSVATGAAVAQTGGIFPATLPDGTVGVSYFQVLTCDICDGFNWIITAGTPPPGITLTSQSDDSFPFYGDGILAGTPTQSGLFSFTVSSINGTRNYTLNIATNNPVISTTSIPGGIAGVPYSTMMFATGGQPPYTWSLPIPSVNGLSINPTTGQLSGTPINGGTISPLTVTLTDSRAGKASRAFTFRALAISTSSVPDGVIGKPYSATLNGLGASPFAFWSETISSVNYLTDGITVGSGSSLPPGLSLSSAGVISGTPTQTGTFPFTVYLTDSQGSISTPLSITVTAGLTITTATIPNGVVGTAYSSAIQGGGGTGTLTFSVSAGSLPAGLTLASNGAITGTPTAAGVSTFTVNATDATNVPVQKAFSITITAAPANLTITTNVLPNGIVSSVYSATLAASAAATWSLVTGTLPAGLTLNTSTGAITGTPTAAGTSTFTVQAQGSGSSAQKQFTITVTAAPSVTVTGLPTTTGPAQQPSASVVLSSTYPLNVTGSLALVFQSTAGADNPESRFSNGTRTANFTVPSGSTQASFGGAANISVLTGTVAGTITITLAATDSSGATIPPGPPIVIVVTPTVPFISSVKVLTVTGGFNIVVTGFSTPRNMVSGQFHFVPTTGNTVNPADVTVQLSSAFTTWYNNATSLPIGSQFSLSVPFNIQGAAAFPISAVSVTLTNSQGTSNPVVGNP